MFSIPIIGDIYILFGEILDGKFVTINYQLETKSFGNLSKTSKGLNKEEELEEFPKVVF